MGGRSQFEFEYGSILEDDDEYEDE